MKLRNVVLFIVLIIFVDQALKIWIKTSFDFGHVKYVMGFHWFELYFIENRGMAWGWEFGGEWGKLALTLFRLVAVVFGTWYLGRIVKMNYHRGFIICAALIYAGALGNLIDSMFYGMIFEESTDTYVAHIFPAQGYAGFLHGRVVDMLHFEFIDSTWPEWIPWIGGDDFQFFSPIFNIADASISAGVITLFVFQKRFFKKYTVVETKTETTEINKGISDNPGVL
ncbi:MAG: lipoprotein signal peptidase [Chitinophagaceae bacterium]|nr:MAG: lipoprotein signal peptidase [Chitinophagaceae bacterium]